MKIAATKRIMYTETESRPKATTTIHYWPLVHKNIVSM